MLLSDIHLYRITHIDNIPHILKYGITHRNSPKANAEYRAIGDTSLIDARSQKLKHVNNGDMDVSYGKIILGDYIPFYFGVRMPMLFVIQRGGNSVPAALSPSDIVYIVCPLIAVVDRQEEFYFTDGHATEFNTSLFDRTCLKELPARIDWNAVRATYWGGSENLTLKARKQAEFLVKDDISPDCIKGFLCYDTHAEERLIEMGVEVERIKIWPKAYY